VRSVFPSAEVHEFPAHLRFPSASPAVDYAGTCGTARSWKRSDITSKPWWRATASSASVPEGAASLRTCDRTTLPLGD
jgi:hypothetical protein